MNYLRFCRFLPLLAFASLVLIEGRAEETPAPPAPASEAKAPHTLTELFRDSITIDFSGGTLAQAVAAVQDKAGNQGFNVLAEKSDLQIEIPPFSLRNAELVGIAGALDELLRPKRLHLQQVSRNVFVVHAREDLPAFPRTHFMSFPLDHLLNVYSIDVITDAIRSGWDLDPAHDPKDLILKFHPGTQLLLVSGTSDSLDEVRQVLAAESAILTSDKTHPSAPTQTNSK